MSNDKIAPRDVAFQVPDQIVRDQHLSGIVSCILVEQHLPKPKAEDNGECKRKHSVSCAFHRYVIARTAAGDPYMMINTKVECTAPVPSKAIPQVTSYPGTKGGSDDKIAFSSVGGALATL